MVSYPMPRIVNDTDWKPARLHAPLRGFKHYTRKLEFETEPTDGELLALVKTSPEPHGQMNKFRSIAPRVYELETYCDSSD